MKYFLVLTCLLLLVSSCRKDTDPPGATVVDQPFIFQRPQGFAPIDVPSDNPFTKEGVELGRHLFYEEKLSGDNSISCATCHRQENAFSDTSAFSKGITGHNGLRNSMPIFNLAWSTHNTAFFWDGRAPTLERQVLFPVQDTLEMNETWGNVVLKLQADPKYHDMFEAAFGSPGIDSVRAAKALAQFIRTLVSGNSPFDQFANNGYSDRSLLHPNPMIADFIWEGWQIFSTDYAGPGIDAGTCFHCHDLSVRLTTDFDFVNSGLDQFATDPGLGGVPGKDPVQDHGKFKTPSLRNLSYTGPYMHDGRFQTLEEVIDFYADDVQPATNLDQDLYHGSLTGDLGAVLSPIARIKLRYFLESLNDPDFIVNQDFSDPED